MHQAISFINEDFLPTAITAPIKNQEINDIQRYEASEGGPKRCELLIINKKTITT